MDALCRFENIGHFPTITTMGKTVPRKIEFCVVSSGGVATSQLLAHLGSRHAVNSETDEDSLKHMPMPAVSFNSAFRNIYLFGDPVYQAVSLFRRGYHSLQARKLQRGYPGPRPELRMTISQYAAGERDLFGFERHFDNYFERHLIHPTLFIRYETLWENLHAIRDFVGCDEETIAGFSPRSRRKSEELALSPESLEQLRAIYRTFTNRLNALPDTFIRGAHLARRRSHLFFSKNLRMAALNAVKARLRPADALYGE